MPADERLGFTDTPQGQQVALQKRSQEHTDGLRAKGVPLFDDIALDGNDKPVPRSRTRAPSRRAA